MARLLPDPTFYPTPAMAGEAPLRLVRFLEVLRDQITVIDSDREGHEHEVPRLVGQSEEPWGAIDVDAYGEGEVECALRFQLSARDLGKGQRDGRGPASGAHGSPGRGDGQGECENT
jgi:hypothetical protein